MAARGKRIAWSKDFEIEFPEVFSALWATKIPAKIQPAKVSKSRPRAKVQPNKGRTLATIDESPSGPNDDTVHDCRY